MSKIGDYKFHEAADIFPMIEAGGVWDAFEADIKAKGVQEKITYWMNPKNDDKIYLDGRNRVQAWVNIRKDDPEFPAPPEEEFVGPESAVLDLVLTKNLQGRRHLKPGQIAAAAAMSGHLMNLYAKREKGDVIAPGDLADYLAKRLGTNRTYLYKTIRLREHRLDLLKQILLGKLTIPAAEKKWAEDDAEARKARGETDANVKDGLGNPADPRFEAQFAAREQFAEVLRLVRQTRGAMKTLASLKEGAEWLDSKEAETFLTNAEAVINAGNPHAVCPVCLGDRKIADPNGGKRKVRCGCCEGRGIVNEARFAGGSAEVAALTPPEETPAPDAPADEAAAPAA